MSSKERKSISQRNNYDNNLSEVEKKVASIIENLSKLSNQKKKYEEDLVNAEKNNAFESELDILEKLIFIDPFNTLYIQKYINILDGLNYKDLSDKLKIYFNQEKSIKQKSDNDNNNLPSTEYNYELYKKIEHLLNEGKYLEARNLIIDNLFENTSDEYLNYLQAKTYFYMGDLLKSQVVLEDLLTSNPNFILARNDLAVIYYQNGLVDKAIECLKESISSGMYNLDILKNLANLYKEIERYEEAINIFRMIIQEYPEDTEALFQMAKLSFEAGYINDAIIYCEKALQIDKDKKEIQNFLENLKSQSKNTEKKNESDDHLVPDDQNNLVSIIIITYNNLYYTRQTIKSIIKYSDLPYEIIVIDNASNDGTQDYLKNNSNIKSILNNTNLGFAVACNQGISVANGKYILILNNDVIVTKNWLSRLVYYMELDPQIGIVGPMTNFISGFQLDKNFLTLNITQEQIINEGDLSIQEYAEAFYQKNKQHGLIFPRITGFCMLISKKLIDTIGGFDEVFGIGNYEDDDYCIRASAANYKSVIASDVFIYHFGSKSFDMMSKENYIELLKENKKKFFDKYGIFAEDIFKENINNINIKNIKIPLNITDSISVNKSENTISLCIIAKDEANNLKKCLDSVVDLVNEIVLVDTGSNDDTINIAKNYGAKIITSNWENDFSKARNLSLSNASSKWILVLDADEILAEESAVELLKIINHNEADAYTIKIYNVLEDDSFNKYEIFTLTRLFKNNKKFTYEGKIHEQIKNSILKEGGRITDSNIKVYHFGYKNINKQKIDRNLSLLKEELEKDPENPYYLYQYGNTLFSKSDNDESIEYLLKAYNCSQKYPGYLNEQSIEKILIKISQYYLQREDIENASKYNELLLKSGTKNPIPKYIKAAILFVNKQYEESLYILNALKDELLISNESQIDLHQIYIDLGNNYYILEKYDEAFSSFQKALELNNNSYIACFNIGQLLYKIGHYDDSLTMFEWSLKLNPELEKANEMINKIKLILSKKE